jgi:hypothetical protein
MKRSQAPMTCRRMELRHDGAGQGPDGRRADLRDKRLNLRCFETDADARRLIEAWRRDSIRVVLTWLLGKDRRRKMLLGRSCWSLGIPSTRGSVSYNPTVQIISDCPAQDLLQVILEHSPRIRIMSTGCSQESLGAPNLELRFVCAGHGLISAERTLQVRSPLIDGFLLLTIRCNVE